MGQRARCMDWWVRERERMSEKQRKVVGAGRKMKATRSTCMYAGRCGFSALMVRRNGRINLNSASLSSHIYSLTHSLVPPISAPLSSACDTLPDAKGIALICLFNFVMSIQRVIRLPARTHYIMALHACKIKSLWSSRNSFSYEFLKS